MIPLSNECVYAVIMEIIDDYLSGNKRTLKEIGKSDLVKKYCGRVVPISTIHYIRRMVDALPYIRSIFRKPRYVSEKTESITNINVEMLPDLIMNWVASLASLWYDSRTLAAGEWWVMDVYSALKGFVNERKLCNKLLEDVSKLIYSYQNNVSYLTGEIVAYKRTAKDYRLYIKFRRSYVQQKPITWNNTYELVELKEALEGLQQKIKILKGARIRDPDKVIITIVKEASNYLRPFAMKERFMKIAVEAASEAIVLAAIAALANLVNEEISRLVSTSLSQKKIVKKIKSDKWRNRIVRQALETIVSQISMSGYIRPEVVKEWNNKNPIRILRTRVTFKDIPRFTILIDITTPPHVIT